MTPKDKAVQIYDNFRNNEPVLQANVKSKNRALICVNAILDAVEFTSKYDYWNQVKKEIEKL